MNSFPKYPGSPPPDPVADVPARAVAGWWDRVARDLAVLLLILAIVGGTRYTAAGIERERAREAEQRDRGRDPTWVYDRLSDRYDFDDLGAWCPLAPEPASPSEIGQLETAARAADPREAMCSPVGKSMAEGRRHAP